MNYPEEPNKDEIAELNKLLEEKEFQIKAKKISRKDRDN